MVKNKIIILLIFILAINVTLYYPFIVYNISLNIANWDKESRVFYSFLAGAFNILLIWIFPIMYEKLEDRERRNKD